MLTKTFVTEVKDMDAAQGVVTAYANAYLNEDSDKDISMPGSFTKTVSENRKRIRVLKDHDPRTTLGVPLEIDTADAYGLKTKTQFNLGKEVSRDMFSDILLAKANGLNAELSIGYGQVRRDAKDNRKITEYGWLGEYSFLSSWAANPLAIVQDVKQLKGAPLLVKLITEAYDLSYSDSRLIQIENILKALDVQPDGNATASATPPDPLGDEAEQFKYFLQLLKTT